MQEFYPFVRDDIVPSFWGNAVQRFLSVLSGNFAILRDSNTAIRVAAGADEAATAIAIDGKWRWNEADVTRSHPGGAAGVYTIWATAADNAIDNSPDPLTDHTNYAFALAITSGAPPAIVPGTVDIFRSVGTLAWDGSKITSITPSVNPLGDFAVSKRKLAGDVLNGYLKIAAAADLAIAFGVSATGSFGGGKRLAGSLAHGLGKTPIAALVTCGWLQTFGDAGNVPVVGSAGVLTNTTVNFTFETANDDVTLQSCPFYWAVLG